MVPRRSQDIGLALGCWIDTSALAECCMLVIPWWMKLSNSEYLAAMCILHTVCGRCRGLAWSEPGPNSAVGISHLFVYCSLLAPQVPLGRQRLTTASKVGKAGRADTGVAPGAASAQRRTSRQEQSGLPPRRLYTSGPLNSARRGTRCRVSTRTLRHRCRLARPTTTLNTHRGSTHR